MEKRILLAVLLMTAVILLTNVLFPPPPRPERAVRGEADTAAAGGATLPVAAPLPAPPVPEPEPGGVADTVTVSTPLYRYSFSTRGAKLVGAELLEHASFVNDGAAANLVPAGGSMLGYRLVLGADTVDLDGSLFRADAANLRLDAGQDPRTVTFRYTGESGFGVTLAYTFYPDRYLVGVRGRVSGVEGQGAVLLTGFGGGLAPNETDLDRWAGELAVVARQDRSVETLRFRALEQSRRVEGPLRWAGIKDRYFLAGMVAESVPFAGLTAARLAPESFDRQSAPRARTSVAVPLAEGGRFGYRVYLGPMEYGRMAAAGSDLEQANPFGYRWLQPILRPIAAAILWVLALLHDNLGIAYGWVLIIFGVMMRVVTWPLHAKAMRAQLRNMAVQPLMQEIREKYQDDPQRQQQEMVRLYKEEGFNPLAGCLPMLIPMPILITLFFVFERTIEFRGVPFLWMPDLSLKDPLFILPVFLMASMFALQIISQKLSGMEMNPQMKMMMYVMPALFGFIFFFLPAGLNLYYATSNVATLPQQVLIARERKKAQEKMKAERARAEPEAKPGKQRPLAPAGENRAARRRAGRKTG
ncbi:MAG: membrane protein insertase YidC [Longimicrobiaceae bacterium]